MNLARFPRVRLAHLPTPLERLPRLSEALGIELWIKRDDCTGLAGGGNKTRKLEFLLGDAMAQGADTLVTQGAVQSNHVRQTAAAAAAHGMGCRIILEERTGSKAHDYLANGNVLLDRLLGAEVRFVPGGAPMPAELEIEAERVKAAGGRPYVIPGGGSNPIGALGYVDCAREIVVQADELDLKVDAIVTATGSAGTQAGLAAGLALMNLHWEVRLVGIGVRAPKDRQEEMVFKLACDTARQFDRDGIVYRECIHANCDYVGEGYGLVDQGVIDALKLAARTEGLLLDPVYSGKAMKGLIDLCRKGFFGTGDTVVFLHTGGAQGLSGYETVLAGSL